MKTEGIVRGDNQVNALMVGTGEYTTGYVHGAAAASDKGAGVVALSLFDLRRRGKLNRLAMVGTNGTKFPGIRAHLQRQVADRYRDMDVSFDSFPADSEPADPSAYRTAIETLSPGDVVTVFTPDDLHLEIALAAIEHGCHVLVAKPLVKTIPEHQRLIAAARTHDRLVAVEVHKRWDPLYADARDRIRALGDFSYFVSYMSQPKSQLSTFSAWAGKSSDISYYLNTHHIDFHLWSLAGIARPRHVTAVAAYGWATGQSIATEDTISLQVEFEHLLSASRGVAIYTASWIAPRSDVHSQQRFFYLGHRGELQIDQAHRGYSTATDDSGFASINPLFMKYTPNAAGEFAGQTGYGYRSIEAFIDAANAIRKGHRHVSDFQDELATAERTLAVTAVLEAGRRSLDEDGRRVTIHYDQDAVELD